MSPTLLLLLLIADVDLVAEARTKLRQGQVAQAVTLLRQALAKTPTSAAITNDLGFAVARSGDRREAEALYRRAMELEPRRVYAYINLAELMSEHPDRWRRQEEVLALLMRGLAAVGDDARDRQAVTFHLAAFERSVGRLGDARARVRGLLADTLPAALRQRVLDLGAALTADERALAFDDWPDPPLTDADRGVLKKAAALIDEGDFARALAILDPLVGRRPTVSAARSLRARALEGLGRHDQAIRELTILLQLKPSLADGWRRLGTILAVHGGSLEAEHADFALRRALSLEPAWDDLRALRDQVAKKRDPGGDRRRPAVTPSPPSAEAQQLLAEARRLVEQETPDLARPLIEQALAKSPGYIDAAVTVVALGGRVPESTVKALWSDGPGLLRLASEILALGRGAGMRPWIDRAIELGVPEASFFRARLRADDGDRTGALADLIFYVANEANPPRLDEARALRARLLGRSDPDHRRAELLILDGKVEDAMRALGGPCRAGLDAAALVAIGRVYEFGGSWPEALACYRIASPSARALERLALVAARAPLPLLSSVETELRLARRARVPAASWAFARLNEERGDRTMALADVQEFLATAVSGDSLIPSATAARARLDVWDRDQRAAGLRFKRLASGLVGVGILSLAAVVLLRRFRGSSLATAIALRPALYPELSRAIAEIRHDLFKHRLSALGLLPAGAARREDVAQAILAPERISQTLAAIYERVGQAAAGLGTALRRLDHEPVFGPLARTLLQTEALLASDGPAEALVPLERRLREVHAPALTGLLGRGPRTTLDAERLTRWTAAVLAEAAPGTPAPGLWLEELDLAVTVEEPALATIFGNLLRNALASVAAQPEPHLLVRTERERDAAGRTMICLLVADSAPRRLTAADFEARPPDRGLGLVRDLVRRWGGQVVLRDQEAPFTKAIGVAFPAAPVREASS